MLGGKISNVRRKRMNTTASYQRWMPSWSMTSALGKQCNWSSGNLGRNTHPLSIEPGDVPMIRHVIG